MSDIHHDEAYSHLAGPALIEYQVPRHNADPASLATGHAHSYFSVPNHNVDGLGIVCGSAAPSITHDSAIDTDFDNSMWQAQINEQIRQFQQVCAQNFYQGTQNASQFLAADESCISMSAGLTESGEFENIVEQRQHDSLSMVTGARQTQSAISFDPVLKAQQNIEAFPSFVGLEDQYIGSASCATTNHASEALASPYPISQFLSQETSNSSQDTTRRLSGAYNTPYLEPAADIHSTYSRRLSESSNPPSSVFSSECQSTPYLMTPCTTPRFPSSMSTELPCTPMLAVSSPGRPNHSRSLSSTSLRIPASIYRPIRPAPYTLDAAQRQRWSTGKAMSLPSRRTQPPEFPTSPEHIRAMSEQNIKALQYNDDFASGGRASFNKSLDVIRNGFQAITAGTARTDDQIPKVKAEDFSPSSQRPVLAVIHPRVPPPLSVLSVPRIPPLDLPEQPSRPISPPPEELSPTEGPAPTQNPVSPYDAYTPKYKRGTKGQLEGFCGLCKPGRWLNMKNSRYWYDKNYNHGINSKTRRAFDLPVERRFKMGHSVIREGLCGTCDQWIDIDSCRMSWKHWWKHAYKVRHLTDYQSFQETFANTSSTVPQQDR